MIGVQSYQEWGKGAPLTDEAQEAEVSIALPSSEWEKVIDALSRLSREKSDEAHGQKEGILKELAEGESDSLASLALFISEQTDK
jgi:hypothetical protein